MEVSPAASNVNSAQGIMALKKVLEAQKQVAAQLIATIARPANRQDSVSISEEAKRLLAQDAASAGSDSSL